MPAHHFDDLRGAGRGVSAAAGPAEIIGTLLLHGGRFAFVCWLH